MKKSQVTSKQAAIAFLVIALLIGSVVTIVQLQQQQQLRGRANTANWAASQSAVALCSSSGSVSINVNFTNNESTRSMIVTATDMQSNQTIDLGIISPSASASGTIDTKMTGLSAGKVIFDLTWTDNPTQKDTKEASYKATSGCQPPPVCTDITQSACTWDHLPDTKEYNVTIKETTSGKTIKTGMVPAPTTKLEFPSKIGETYECSVNAVNICGAGKSTKSPAFSCPIPPTPTIPVCKEDESICTWDSLPDASQYEIKITDTNSGETIKSGIVPAPVTQFAFPFKPGTTYRCTVNAINKCGTGKSKLSPPTTCEITPTPTTTPTPPSGTPTETPTITTTPKLTPTDTPIPTPTNTPPPTPTNTPPPTPTNTPIPTPTNTPPPTPTNTPVPTQTPYPTYTPFPTPTPVIIIRTQPTTPPQIIVRQVTVIQQVNTTQQKTFPTLAPTGNFETATLIGGISVFLMVLGGLVFLIL